MILSQIPSEWIWKNYVAKNDKDETVVSKKSPKEVIEYFEDLNKLYMEDYGKDLVGFDDHEINEDIEIPKDLPETAPIP